MVIKDKGEVWGFVWPGSDMNTVYYDDGTTAPMSTDLVFVNYGKYEGRLLSEVEDVGYLEWSLKTARKNNDVFQQKVISMRLKELSE